MIQLFKHLLPRTRAWKLTTDKRLRQFFDGLGGIVTDTKAYLDDVHDDLDPALTRRLGYHEAQFGLLSVAITEPDRRARVDASWKATGGQSPGYIQDTLQAAGFDVYVHEWWAPLPPVPPASQQPLVPQSPVARNPHDYLSDILGPRSFDMFDGGADAQDGDQASQDGGTTAPVGYPLVNKILIGTNELVGDGSAQMQDGGTRAVDGGELVLYGRLDYILPSDPLMWPYFLYIGGEAFPTTANVLQTRQDEFEDLCLRICPTEQWLGILVNYS